MRAIKFSLMYTVYSGRSSGEQVACLLSDTPTANVGYTLRQTLIRTKRLLANVDELVVMLDRDDVKTTSLFSNSQSR